MNRSLISIVVICLVAIAVAGARGQGADGQSTDGQPTVRLRLTPAGPSRPALGRALLYDAADLRQGDAAPLYLTSTLLAAQARAAGIDAGRGDGERLDRFLDAPAAELERDRAAAQSLLGRYDSALHHVTLGSQRESCRWDLPLREDGINTLLPHLAELRKLAQLLSLRARLQVLDKRFDDAAATLRVGMTLSRHLNEQAPLVQSQFAAGVAGIMAERIQEFVGAPGAPNLYWPLSALPQPFIDPVQPMQWERSFLAFAVPDLARAARGELPVEQWQKVWRTLRQFASPANEPGGRALPDEVVDTLLAARDYPAAKKALIASGVPPERVEALPVGYVLGAYHYRRYQEWSDELWKAFALPYWQGAGVISRALREMDRAESVERHNPFMVLLPGLTLTRLRLAQADRSIAVLRVIEAIRAYAADNDGRLPESLDDVKAVPLPFDPVSGKPFRFVRIGDGAMLQAQSVPAEQSRPAPRFEISIVR